MHFCKLHFNSLNVAVFLILREERQEKKGPDIQKDIQNMLNIKETHIFIEYHLLAIELM